LIENAVQQLSPEKRRVFERCKLEENTYEHAASQMHLSKHTAKEYLPSAMKNIREFVKTVPSP